MTAIKFDRFGGLLPRMPESLLPPSNASAAANCEFAYGELRNTKGDFLAQTLGNSPSSLYTDDGLAFYSWMDDVAAARSPLSNDPNDLLYYTTPTDFRVAARAGMSIHGGAPASSYRVGVPKPASAPVMTVPATPSLATSTIAARFHYEYAGVKYQEQAIDLVTVAADSKWSFTPPEKNVVDPAAAALAALQTPPVELSGTPEQAFVALHMVAADNVTHGALFDIYTSNSALSVPGDWSLELAQSDNDATYSATMSVPVPDKETRAYVYTYVNTYNEEGPPSPPGVITALAKLAFAVAVARDTLPADYAPIKEIRIYRTPSGSAEVADYFYVGSIFVLTQSGSAFTFIDDVEAAGLNEPLASENYYAPNPALVGLTSLPNGILMAWKGNELHFSDAYKPWSWPPQYVKTFTRNIVGCLAHGAGALVTTQGNPFFISGVSPDSMTESKINSPQAGVSKWAMADVMGMLAYASHDGIVVIDGNQATLAFSDPFFTRDVWRARCGAGLASMRFAVWDGRLVVYSSAAAFTPFLIRLDEARGAMTDLPGLAAACSFVSPLSDQCYVVRGNALYQFAGGSDTPASWQSREIVFNAPLNFGIAQAVCEGSWSVSVIADGVVRHTQALIGNQTFRLPSGFKSARWKVAIAGVGRFRELRIAETPHELVAI